MTAITIRLQGCRKAFADGTVAVHDLNLTVEGGETLAILGPSGCGKTTTLRLIAGLERPDVGQVFFGDQDVTRLPIERRDVGMVFQNYALFPNLDVAGNIVYGLKIRGVPVQERNRAALDSFSAQLELALRAAAESHAVTMSMPAPQASIALCAMFDGLLQSWLLGRAFDLKQVGAQAVDVAPLRPSNCGFDAQWSAHFQEKFAGSALKNVAITFRDACGQALTRRGECVVSAHGIEGNLVYAFSAAIRDEINTHGSATILLDLAPDRDPARLRAELERGRGAASLANHLRKQCGIDGVRAGLLRELLDKDSFNDMARLAAAIKALPLTLYAARPLDEAISSAGGVPFAALDDGLMLKALPGVFCAGEMLDWEAPTGGYLLTACFASGRMAALGVLNWLR